MSKKVSLAPICRNNIIFILQAQGASSKKAIREAYVALEPDCSTAEDWGVMNNGWSKIEGAIHTGSQWLVKKGLIVKAGRGLYDVAPTTPEVSEFTPYLNSNPSTPAPLPTPTPATSNILEEEEIAEVSEVEVPEVEVSEVGVPEVSEIETKIPVSVSNEAVLEAHIDLGSNELVENVGGTRDYRKPLDQVEDGYIVSNVEITTSTLNVEPQESQPAFEETVSTLEVQEEETVEVQETQEEEVVNEPVVEEIVEEVVEPTPTPEVSLEDDLDGFFDELEEETPEEEEETLTYDIKELRRTASFDPVEKTLKSSQGKDFTRSYEVYRDTDRRNLVITQTGRVDYVICPIDVAEGRDFPDPRYVKFANMAISQFDEAKTHKDGSALIIKALITCVDKCQHTDDLAGFTDTCLNPKCPIHVIWSPGATYVDPTL